MSQQLTPAFVGKKPRSMRAPYWRYSVAVIPIKKDDGTGENLYWDGNGHLVCFESLAVGFPEQPQITMRQLQLATLEAIRQVVPSTETLWSLGAVSRYAVEVHSCKIYADGTSYYNHSDRVELRPSMKRSTFQSLIAAAAERWAK